MNPKLLHVYVCTIYSRLFFHYIIFKKLAHVAFFFIIVIIFLLSISSDFL